MEELIFFALQKKEEKKVGKKSIQHILGSQHPVTV